ncbi:MULTISPECIES: hypothetical protein [unclassified Streptococcus]|uniref:hypothetical protein n=1 Tax=unclassified Streptococcus TaxID=2608887 RepID=UPI00211B588D|nr:MULTISPECIES: hypothetical protein [unclassified Streptococcus]MCQ9211850.1 hypothetical protein [Streptococcus sp. B01]MCQ9212880.1 hypothetical protein [Streptococcus sp. B01]MCQ9212971.1 hypothetical protein [Streptococcus sp. O1]MCQ9214996.1 hypothetical protein [Streptococcus sp. O1]
MIKENDILVHCEYGYGLHVDFYKVVKVTAKQIKITKVRAEKVNNERGTFYIPTGELVADVYHEAGVIRTIKKADCFWLDGMSLEKYVSPIKEYIYSMYA